MTKSLHVLLGTIALVLCTLAAAAEGVPVKWGRLPTNDPTSSGDNAWIADWEIANWIAMYFEDGNKTDKVVDSNAIFVGTVCYSGNFHENFNGQTGQLEGGANYDNVSFTNANSITNSSSDRMTLGSGGGSGQAILGSITPGTRAVDVFNAGSAAAFNGESSYNGNAFQLVEQPQFSGAPFRTLGGTTSTHILMWAGSPEPRDLDAMSDILNTWITHPNTTITILSGNSPASTSNVGGNTLTRGPASRSELKDAIRNVGALMDDGADEQFIFVSLDHGNHFAATIDPGTVIGANPVTFAPGTQVVQVEVPLNDVLSVFDLQTEAVAQLRFATALDVDLIVPEVAVGFDIGGYFLGDIFYATPMKSEIQLPNGATVFEYSLPIERSLLVPPGIDLTDQGMPDMFVYDVRILNFTPGFDISFDYLGISTGAIAPLAASVPLPTAGALLVVPLLGTLRARRYRRQRRRDHRHSDLKPVQR